MTTGGMKRSIQRVPMRRMMSAHRMKMSPAHTIADPIPAAPAAADARATGPMKLNEGPK